MKIRSAVPENSCLIVLVDGKNIKQKKTTAKHIRIRLLLEGGCVNEHKQSKARLKCVLFILTDVTELDGFKDLFVPNSNANFVLVRFNV